MPHLIIEYSANAYSATQGKEITKLAHDIMSASGLFSVADIKTRSYRTEDFLVGEMGREGSFVHVTVYLLEGRTDAQKQCLTEALCKGLQQHLSKVDQLSVDIRDMVRDTYRKHVGS